MAAARQSRPAILRSTIAPPSDDNRPPPNLAVRGFEWTGDRPGSNGVVFRAMGGVFGMAFTPKTLRLNDPLIATLQLICKPHMNKSG